MNARLSTPLLLLTSLALQADAAGFDAARMAWAERGIEQAIDRGEIPGAVLLVGRGDDILYNKAFGHRSIRPEKTPMTPDTVFDLASLTKPVATAASVMLLIERGQLNLNDRVATHIPAFAARNKQDVTVADLLLHRSGLTPDNPMPDYLGSRADILDRICSLPLLHPPDSRFVYSDVGYILLGELVRLVDGRPIDQFSRQEIFQPLGMNDTTFNPPDGLRPRCAPTEQRDGRWMVGQVHDPRAWSLGGVAGHAGLFSTADDLSRFCRMILHRGTLDGKRVLADRTVREMIRPRCLPDHTDCRTCGFDVNSSYASARGSLFDPDDTIGHTGFTGTMLWIDPVHACYAILLTNRVHPDGKGLVGDLRSRVMSVVAAALVEAVGPGDAPAPVRLTTTRPRDDASPLCPPEVLCGIDVLERDGFRLLAGRRVALLTNHTGRDRRGRRTIDLLASAPGVRLVRLLSPEHGLAGAADQAVPDAVDEKTGLKIYSLYGPTQRPTPPMLDGIDAVVFDIQDIGTRFYTYVGTLGFVMEEAARCDLEVVVLDRPNPLGGACVDGPLWEKPERALVGFGPLPVVHGMTVGELARLFNDRDDLRCRLLVVPVEGWRRTMAFDATGLTWINPSPNMRNLNQAMLYPGVGLLETTNLSVGRGTDQPFETLGAPWIDGPRLAAALNAPAIPGLRFVPIEFTPRSSTFAGQPCRGVSILLADRRALAPVRAGLTIAWHLHKLFASTFEIERMAVLLGNSGVLDALRRTDDPGTLPDLWRLPLLEFRAIRARYLLYHD